uniref:MRP-like transporter n=1 Tax=Ganoderma boninense TaxID=34458 RepID=A0A5K1JYR4_9APHY|nr:MRP-like transporter [Ganoderma boninense]
MHGLSLLLAVNPSSSLSSNVNFNSLAVSMHPSTFIHDVSFDCHTVPSTDEERRFQLYLLLKQLTSYDHRERVSYKSLYDEGKRWVSSYPAWKLERGADLHDGRVMLELCIRRISYCEVDTHAAANDPEGVEAILSKLIIFGADHTASYHIFNCTPATKARTLALILWTEFVSILNLLTSEDTGKRVMFRLLPHMALHADACARIDFLPPIVLRVAYWLSTFEQRFGVDARMLPMFAEREYLPSLRKVYGDYVQK